MGIWDLQYSDLSKQQLRFGVIALTLLKGGSKTAQSVEPEWPNNYTNPLNHNPVCFQSKGLMEK